MRRILCGTLPKKIPSRIEIPETEAKHLTSVLRLGAGDEIELLDGEGYTAKGTLGFREKRAFAELLEIPQTDPRRLSLPVHLKMAIIKGDAMEWVVEKAVEMGVRTLTPIETEFTVVKIHKKGADTFQERWQRIADQALKQCGRLDRMEILPPQSFEGLLLDSVPLVWLDETLARETTPETHLTHFLQSLPQSQDSALLVGPEGGFSPSERGRLLQLTLSGKKAINRVHLGALILRAETAAMMGVSIMIGDHYGKRKNPV